MSEDGINDERRTNNNQTRDSPIESDNLMKGDHLPKLVFFPPGDDDTPKTPSAAMDNGNFVSKKEYRNTWNQAWYDFACNTSVHGISQIFEVQPYLLRRIIWIVLVLLGLTMFLYQMISGIVYYYQYPVSVNVKINYNDTISFPAMTICNQNAFRKTVAATNGWYVLLSGIYMGQQNFSNVDFDDYNATDLSLYDVHDITGHDKHDLIIGCTWDAEPCSADDFVTTMTEYGKCYTFNSGNNRIRQAKRTGSNGGLQLLVNVEQYEYMPGPNQGAGIRVHLHDQEEVPLVKDFGVAMPPGSYSLLGMTMIRIQNLPHPHGQCDSKPLKYHGTYTKTNCLENCKQIYLEQRCHCKHINMVNTTEPTPFCSLGNYQSCAMVALQDFNLDRSTCGCPIPCEMESLEMFNSIGDISGFDALSLLNSPLTDRLRSKFVLSNEITQRVNTRIVLNDKKMVDRLWHIVNQVDFVLSEINDNLEVLEGSLGELFIEMNQRTYFHKETGLEKVKYIMAHDFVRGWTIIEERSLPYLTFGFYELRGGYRRAIERMRQSQNGTEQEKLISLILWKEIENELLDRLDIHQRVSDNITEVHTQYKTGEPLLAFRASKDRRYDMAWITVELLQAIVDDSTHNQDKIYSDIFRRLSQINESIYVYLDMADNFLKTYTMNEQAWEDNDWLFRKGCVQFNYNVFLFSERIVNGPMIVMTEKLKEFDILTRAMTAADESLRMTVTMIRNLIANVNSTQLPTIRAAVEEADKYLSDPSKNKTELVEIFTSKGMIQMIKDVELFFGDLRSGGRNIQEKVQTLKVTVENVWINMLTEYTTKKFYAKVHEDWLAFPDDREFYLPYFTDLLHVDVVDLANVSDVELERRLNADFVVTDLTDRINDIKYNFDALKEMTNIARILGVTDEHFASSIGEYMASLESFVKNNEIDVDFYKENFIQLDVFMQELSYEEILQQPAYDTLSLFGDIGGSIGLFLGASALTIAEILDVLILQLIRLGAMH